jgi:hypothetical protein
VKLIENGYINDSEVEHAIKEEKARIKFTNVRLELLTMSRFKRFPHTLRFLRSGGYRYFNGWKSVARDIILS